MHFFAVYLTHSTSNFLCFSDITIQNIVLDSSWFKSSSRLCAYISCETLREVDTSRILLEVLKEQDTGMFYGHICFHACFHVISDAIVASKVQKTL